MVKKDFRIRKKFSARKLFFHQNATRNATRLNRVIGSEYPARFSHLPTTSEWTMLPSKSPAGWLGISHTVPSFLLSAKSRACCGYALVNAGMTPPLRRQPFAGYMKVHIPLSTSPNYFFHLPLTEEEPLIFKGSFIFPWDCRAFDEKRFSHPKKFFLHGNYFFHQRHSFFLDRMPFRPYNGKRFQLVYLFTY